MSTASVPDPMAGHGADVTVPLHGEGAFFPFQGILCFVCAPQVSPGVLCHGCCTQTFPPYNEKWAWWETCRCAVQVWAIRELYQMTCKLLLLLP